VIGSGSLISASVGAICASDASATNHNDMTNTASHTLHYSPSTTAKLHRDYDIRFQPNAYSAELDDEKKSDSPSFDGALDSFEEEVKTELDFRTSSTKLRSSHS